MAELAGMVLANELDLLQELMLTPNQHYQTHYDDNGDRGASAEV